MVKKAQEDPSQDSLKTCFVDSFKFEHFTKRDIQADEARRLEGKALLDPPPLDIPLKEFIEFIEQTEMVMYFGSLTEEPCSETVTWLVNQKPHVITENQLSKLRNLLSDKMIPDLNKVAEEGDKMIGGNFRDI